VAPEHRGRTAHRPSARARQQSTHVAGRRWRIARQDGAVPPACVGRRYEECRRRRIARLRRTIRRRRGVVRPPRRCATPRKARTPMPAAVPPPNVRPLAHGRRRISARRRRLRRHAMICPTTRRRASIRSITELGVARSAALASRHPPDVCCGMLAPVSAPLVTWTLRPTRADARRPDTGEQKIFSGRLGVRPPE
jgi:hypothetical protein